MLFTVDLPDFPRHNNEYEDQLGFNDMNESDIKNEQEHQDKNMTDGELNDIFEEGMRIGIDMYDPKRSMIWPALFLRNNIVTENVVASVSAILLVGLSLLININLLLQSHLVKSIK